MRTSLQTSEPTFYHRQLVLDGYRIIENCTHMVSNSGSFYLEDNALLVILEGSYELSSYAEGRYMVNAGEMILVRKSVLLSYIKTPDSEKGNIFDCLMFVIKDELLRDFIKQVKIERFQQGEVAKVLIAPVQERLQKFFDSVRPYFKEHDEIAPGLLRLKMLELLYDLVGTDKELLKQMLQLKRPIYKDITSIVENNYDKPLTLNDLAVLSGRSLSSFKRDFEGIYKSPPAQWIRERRLAKAKELLLANMAVNEVTLTLGFESVAHFSKLFKEHTGYSPSQFRSNNLLKIIEPIWHEA